MKKINVKGAITSNDDKWVYDYFEMDSTCPRDIESQLPDNGENVEILINSGGGDLYAGSEIYTTLKSYQGNVNIKVLGIAASAASLIAMAGDKVEISPVAQIMIHNVSMGLGGDHRDFSHGSSVLKGHDKSIANAYGIKTGKSEDEILALMNEETWLDAKMAVEHGFADGVMFTNEAPKLVASINTPVFTSNMINKVMTMKQASENNLPTIDAKDVSKMVAEALEKELKKQNSERMSNKFKRYTF